MRSRRPSPSGAPYYRDRADAADHLIRQLSSDIDSTWLVLALPRGGVPIAAAIARHLGTDFDLLIVRKVGLPGHPELAVAAVTGAEPEDMAVNELVARYGGLSRDRLRELAAGPVREVEERRRRWKSAAASREITGRRVLLVDDGAATGTTLDAALSALRQQGAGEIAVALPVALRGALDHPSLEGVRVICPHSDADLPAVGCAYDGFAQTTDEEVGVLLAASRASTPE
ncbi:phosphoribosyltransferase [Histidinibacterium aquaticum]|uniref:Phosphoribosyltransferase n=1 Tax=Histidinibacterium aquaticum TaxID=2613962 RepID=A0A5J5GG06_9RHOB|nr:phosphoribosyltransferase family protein [Histidinibacterium aquaticum]KAA9006708.1 phosphoribosyltransferase [Histidinibacterium aquaticum]